MESVRSRQARKVPKALRSVLQMDLFKTETPRFHLGGVESQGNVIGTLCSIAILLIMAAYASLKFEHLISKYNPDISWVEKENYIEADEVLNLRKERLRVAFSVTDMSATMNKNDPRYVRFITRTMGHDG